MKTQIITNDTFYIDIVRFCEKNEIADIDEFVSQCLKSGFFIEKYGLLNDDSEKYNEPKEIIIEKIIEVPVDRIVEKIVEVPVDRIVEKIVEIPVDRIVEKVVEVIREVPIHKEVIKEIPSSNVRVEIREIEVIKEVPIIKEVFVLKEVLVNNLELENQFNDLNVKFNNLVSELNKKNRIIEDYRATFEASKSSARYHKSSNIRIN
jgi:hypothetical protein